MPRNPAEFVRAPASHAGLHAQVCLALGTELFKFRGLTGDGMLLQDSR